MSDTKDDDQRAKWTGRLIRGDTAGTVTGYLQDSWGWRVEITGHLNEHGAGYLLEGVTGPPPESLRVPIVDDPVTKDG